MPELPEVESIAAALRRGLTGQRCGRLKVRHAGLLAPTAAAVRRALVGRVLAEVQRHGKYLVLVMDDPGPSRVMVHLRMTGQILALDDYTPDKHVHLTLDFDGHLVHYRDIRKFGRWSVVGADWRERELAHVGPDMLTVKFDDWYARLRHRRAPLKSVLLNQGVAAGLGNIYVDEAMFRAGMHPLARPVELSRDQLHEIWRQSKAVLRLAIRHGGTTFLNFTDFHGRPGNFRGKLRVYGRAGEACRSCGCIIERLVIGGRSSCYCPDCQATHVHR